MAVPEIGENSRAGARRPRTLAGLRLGTLDDLLGVLLALLVIGSALAIASVFVQVLLADALVAGLIGALAVWRIPIRRWPAPTWVLVALALYTLLQAAPLPAQLVTRLSPNSAAVWQGALHAIGSTRARFSLSLDPGASIVEALKWFCYACVFAGAARVARTRGATFGVAVVFAAALAVALITLAHWMLGARSLYGIYTPRYASPRPSIGPFLNSNNFAGYMNLGGFCGLALLGASAIKIPKPLIGVGTALVFALGAVAASRAAWFSLLLGIALLPLTLRFGRFRPSAATRTLLLSQLVVAAAGIALFFFAADSAVWRALFGEGIDKFRLFRWTLPLIRDHFWFGIGRGSFETAFPAYQGDSARQLYHMAENFVLQWQAEWGVPVALAAIGAFAWTLRPAKLGLRESPLVAGAAIGAFTLVAQNLLDLGLELPSVSFALFALLGSLYGAQERRARTERGQTTGVAYLPACAVALSTGALILAAARFGLPTAADDRDRVADALHAGRRSAPATLTAAAATAEQAILRHPAEHYLFLSRAWIAERASENPLPWISRAIERDPLAPAPYLLLARTLLASGFTNQGLSALRMTVERDSQFAGVCARLVLAASHDHDVMLRAVPEGKKGAPLLAALAVHIKNPDFEALRARLFDEAIQRDPAATQTLVFRGNELVSELERGVEPCASQREQCVARLRDIARLLERADPESERPVVYRARLLLLDQRAPEALRLLSDACPSGASATECAMLRVIAAEMVGDARSLRSASDAYLAAACTSESGCSAAGSWLGSRFEQKGDWASALRVYERVASQSSSATAWRRVALTAAHAGFGGEARRALGQFKAAGGDVDPELKQAFDRLATLDVDRLSPRP